MLLEEELSYKIRGAVYEVYSELGHGFLEKIYERALFRELTARELATKCQVPLAVRYKGEVIGEYFVDMISKIGSSWS